jgi:putative sterol carrier protein
MAARDFFEGLEARADRTKLEGLDHSYLFEIEGEGRWLVVVSGGGLTVTEGDAPADVTITTSGQTFEKLRAGKQNPLLAYMSGKLKVDGDTAAAMKLQKLF